MPDKEGTDTGGALESLWLVAENGTGFRDSSLELSAVTRAHPGVGEAFVCSNTPSGTKGGVDTKFHCHMCSRLDARGSR